MDDIGQRLREAADNCIKAYEGWSGGKKNIPAREALQEAVHELRKVAARLEIDMAASERDEMTQRQIPIPPHRASRRHDQNGNVSDFSGGDESEGDSIGNSVEGSEGTPRQRSSPNNPGRMQRPQQRRPMRRPESGGE